MTRQQHIDHVEAKSMKVANLIKNIRNCWSAKLMSSISAR